MVICLLCMTRKNCELQLPVIFRGIEGMHPHLIEAGLIIGGFHSRDLAAILV